mmetsp:Transcript_72064/g.169613  ORF Transcript_72064/g.169613 Transcript_72064/m.169613 type:complete len:205 (-) Transcript_72064:124-738(-)
MDSTQPLRHQCGASWCGAAQCDCGVMQCRVWRNARGESCLLNKRQGRPTCWGKPPRRFVSAVEATWGRWADGLIPRVTLARILSAPLIRLQHELGRHCDVESQSELADIPRNVGNTTRRLDALERHLVVGSVAPCLVMSAFAVQVDEIARRSPVTNVIVERHQLGPNIAFHRQYNVGPIRNTCVPSVQLGNTPHSCTSPICYLT